VNPCNTVQPQMTKLCM